MSLRRSLFASVTVAAVFASGCSSLTVAAATVNGQKISESEVEAELDRVRSDPTFEEALALQPDEGRGEFRRFVLTGLIQQVIVEQGAEELGVEVTDDQIDALIDGETARVGLSREEFLAQENLSADQLRLLARRVVRRFAVRDEVAGEVEISEERLAQSYQLNAEAFQEVHLYRITVATEQEARDAIERLEAGRSFSGLAAEISIDPQADDGGDLGYIPLSALNGLVQGALGQAAADGGTITRPVPTIGGFEIYRRVDQRTQDFEDVRDDIEEQIAGQEREARFEAWVQARMASADIVVNPKFGDFDPETRAIVPPSGVIRP